MDLLKQLSELEITPDVSELDLDGELPDIRNLETKYLYCNFNKALKLSLLPQTLELLSCNNQCRILTEDAPLLPNVKGFIDANDTIVDSWEHLFHLNDSAMEYSLSQWITSLKPYYMEGSELRNQTLEVLTTSTQ
jgi:hypothetical protein